MIRAYYSCLQHGRSHVLKSGDGINSPRPRVFLLESWSGRVEAGKTHGETPLESTAGFDLLADTVWPTRLRLSVKIPLQCKCCSLQVGQVILCKLGFGLDICLFSLFAITRSDLTYSSVTVLLRKQHLDFPRVDKRFNLCDFGMIQYMVWGSRRPGN